MLLVGSDPPGPGDILTTPYLAGLFGGLCGLLDVWPISHGGVMQVFFGIFFVSNLYLEKKMFIHLREMSFKKFSFSTMNLFIKTKAIQLP